MDQMRQIFPRYEIRPLKDFLSLMSSTSLPGSIFYRKHDCTRGFNRLPGDPAFHVHDCDRADTGHRRPEIHGRVEAYIIRALLGESALICAIGIVVGIAMSYLTRAVFSFRISDSVDSDYGGMGSAVCRNRRGRRAAGCELPGLARQPQGCH